MILTTDIQELFDLKQMIDMLLCVCILIIKLKKAQKWTDKNKLFIRKNWSIWCFGTVNILATVLLPQKLVNDPEITGAYLHRFSWLEDKEIGKLDLHGTT